MKMRSEIEEALENEDVPLIVKINGLEIHLEKRLYKKINKMCERIAKGLDACLINEGYEGDGKTTSSLIETATIKSIIPDRSIHLFFKTSSCMDFAKKTEKKIIILDEPALESLSNDQTTINKDFFRLTSTMRKKRHFFIINFTKFWKFPDFLIVDRALGMVRMDSKNGKYPRRFLYIRQKNLEKLWNEKKKHNKRSYNKLRSFQSRMPKIELKELFDALDIEVEGQPHCSENDYDKLKDKAIESIGESRKSKRELITEETLKNLRYRVSQLPALLKVSHEILGNALQINPRRLREWRSLTPPPPL